ncbi:MAG: hypothetical protein K2Q45_10825, partial [Nitrosomonas sp.]|nr:hypothetical protein [Nitrosomonas sp.]
QVCEPIYPAPPVTRIMIVTSTINDRHITPKNTRNRKRQYGVLFSGSHVTCGIQACRVLIRRFIDWNLTDPAIPMHALL